MARGSSLLGSKDALATKRHDRQWGIMGSAHANLSDGGIVVDGLVVCRRILIAADLAPLPRFVIEEDFVCEEGWAVPHVRWCGILLTDVLATAQFCPTARYVRVCAGAYALPVPLSASQDALLCDRMKVAR